MRQKRGLNDADILEAIDFAVGGAICFATGSQCTTALWSSIFASLSSAVCDLVAAKTCDQVRDALDAVTGLSEAAISAALHTGSDDLG